MEPGLIENLVETWAIHNRINVYLLEAVPEENLTAAAAKGRTVHALFSHIHNTRLMWLKPAAPDLLVDLVKLETTGEPKAVICDSLERSGEAISTLLVRGLAPDRRIKGFKPHAVAYLGYMISHESHHRGQIEWALRLAGLPLPDAISYGMWEWGVR